MPLRRWRSTDREARAGTHESDADRSSRTLRTHESDTDIHGSRTSHAIFARHPSKPAGVVSAAGSVPVNELNRLHFENCRMPRTLKEKAEERHVDSWAKDGQDGRWTRVHRSGRRALFTPFKVAGGPGAKTALKRIRITRGKYFASGKTFKIIDDWTTRANSHRLLQGSWIGTTDFREVAEYIDDDSDEEAFDISTHYYYYDHHYRAGGRRQRNPSPPRGRREGRSPRPPRGRRKPGRKNSEKDGVLRPRPLAGQAHYRAFPGSIKREKTSREPSSTLERAGTDGGAALLGSGAYILQPS